MRKLTVPAGTRRLLPAGQGEGDRERERGQHDRERPHPAPPRPSPRHPVYLLLKMARAFSRPAPTPFVTLERIGAAARAASSTSSNRKLSSIELIRENTTAGPGPSGKGAEDGVREHSTPSPQTRIQVAVAAVSTPVPSGLIP